MAAVATADSRESDRSRGSSFGVKIRETRRRFPRLPEHRCETRETGRAERGNLFFPASLPLPLFLYLFCLFLYPLSLSLSLDNNRA